MNKNEIAILGCGKCGCSLLDELLNISPMYNGVFMNTNMFELEELEHFSSNNALHINIVGGLGADREKGKKIMKEFAPKILNFLDLKFPISSGVNTFFIFSSSSGGTGSSLAVVLPKLIKMINEDAVVNIIGTLVPFNSEQNEMQNCINYWNEIITLFDEGYINSVQLIDNSKMKDESTFNKMTMKEFNDGLSVNYRVIDVDDSKRVNNTRGYKVTLTLDNKIRDIKRAVDNAIKSSNFVLPSDFECESLMATFDEEYFDKEAAKDIFSPYQKPKYDYNDEGRNIFVLGGCNFPRDTIEELGVSLLSVVEGLKERRDRFKNLSIDSEDIIEPKVKKETVNKKRKRITTQDLNDLYDKL